jgi:hypothetical protein
MGIGQILSACGQKGDLYLPESEKETSKDEKARSETDAPSGVSPREGSKDGKGAGTPASDVPRLE